MTQRIRRVGSHPGISSRRGFGFICSVAVRDLACRDGRADLSESGLGAFVAEALVLGEFVTLEVPLPDCDKQVIPAKVIRALGTEYGFQFTALSAEQRTRIRATVKAHPVIPYHGKGG